MFVCIGTCYLVCGWVFLLRLCLYFASVGRLRFLGCACSFVCCGGIGAALLLCCGVFVGVIVDVWLC